MTILELVQNETGCTYRRKGSASNEYAGPCPFCQAGDDRFLLWPAEGRYWCRVCNRKGDDIQFVRDFKHMDYRQARAYLDKPLEATDPTSSPHALSPRQEPQLPPTGVWADQAWPFVFACQAHLMEHNTNERARAWLHGRRLEDATLWQYGIGYHPADRYLDRAAWGLPPAHNDKGNAKRLWLPRGIVIPWVIDGKLWGIRIRRPVGAPKYYWIPGGTPALYNAGALTSDRPAILVEGEIDALTVAQAAGASATVVATGSTHGSRRVRWLARLAATPAVLVAYDADDAGETAARYWLDALPNARRWRLFWGDANDLACDGVDMSSWVMAGLVTQAKPVCSGTRPDL